MGMDVYGLNPKNSEGEYFRRNNRGWRVIADVVTSLCPQESAACQNWFSNDGDGLTEDDARALAQALRHNLNTGAVRSYVIQLDAALDCGDLAVTGSTSLLRALGQFGLAEAVSHDELDSSIREFIEFLEGCGGFEIW